MGAPRSEAGPVESMSVAVLGEALIDLIADNQGLYRPHLGGSPFNVAIGLARQGVAVDYLSPLSNDRFGDLLADKLCSEGVRVAIKRRSSRPTSLAVVALDEQGLPAYRLYREGVADKDTSLDEVMAALPAGIRIFHTGSLAITPSQLPRIHRLIERLRRRGVLISIDINIRIGASHDTARYLDGVRSLFPVADILKGSDEDLAGLGLGSTPLQAAREARSLMNGGLLVVTRGAAGALAINACGLVESRAARVEHVGDTVGAGDTFHAALLAALLADGHPEMSPGNASAQVLGDALTYASTAAAINVGRHGCAPPTRDETRARLNAAGE